MGNGQGAVRCEEKGAGLDPTIKLFEAAPEVASAVGISLVPPPVIDELDKIHVHRTKAPARADSSAFRVSCVYREKEVVGRAAEE